MSSQFRLEQEHPCYPSWQGLCDKLSELPSRTWGQNKHMTMQCWLNRKDLTEWCLKVAFGKSLVWMSGQWELVTTFKTSYSKKIKVKQTLCNTIAHTLPLRRTTGTAPAPGASWPRSQGPFLGETWTTAAWPFGRDAPPSWPRCTWADDRPSQTRGSPAVQREKRET